MGPVALTSGTATGGQEVSLAVFAKDVADGSDEERLALAQRLKDAGLWKGNISNKFNIKYYSALVKLEEQYQGQIALDKLLNVPTTTNRYDSLTSLLADEEAGASKTRVSKSTRLSDSTTAEALVTAVMQDQVGRGPSTAELKKYTQALQTAQAAAPTTTVTTSRAGATTSPITGEVTSGATTSKTTGGINEQQFLINEIAGTDEARAQKVKSYYDVFKQAIGVS
jgi:hypothetical protein